MQTKRPVNHLEVGKRLEFARRLRKAQSGGFSKSSVAASAGMSPSAYTQWIDGTTRSYDAAKLTLVADHLGVRVPWLLWGVEPMEDSKIEHAAAELMQDSPPEVVSETLHFMGYQMQKWLTNDPAKLGRYLKTIDDIIRSKSNGHEEA